MSLQGFPPGTGVPARRVMVPVNHRRADDPSRPPRWRPLIPNPCSPGRSRSPPCDGPRHRSASGSTAAWPGLPAESHHDTAWTCRLRPSGPRQTPSRCVEVALRNGSRAARGYAPPGGMQVLLEVLGQPGEAISHPVVPGNHRGQQRERRPQPGPGDRPCEPADGPGRVGGGGRGGVHYQQERVPRPCPPVRSLAAALGSHRCGRHPPGRQQGVWHGRRTRTATVEKTANPR
jgi:hypothetical protein